jgi:type IV secretory pathway VirJ component
MNARSVALALVFAFGTASQGAAQAPAPSVAQGAGPSAFKDLPLIEVVAPKPSNTFAVFVSGDGGWAAMDKGISAALQKHGVSVAGINAAKYFWRTRSPDGAGADLGLMIRHFLDAWKAESVVVIGYSRGAGVVPFMVNRLPPELRGRVRLVVLIGAEHTAGFTFHVLDILNTGPGKNEPPVLPEIEKLGATPLLCFYGTDETDTLCPELKLPHTIVKLPGGHHLDGNYGALGEKIYEELRRSP